MYFFEQGVLPSELLVINTPFFVVVDRIKSATVGLKWRVLCKIRCNSSFGHKLKSTVGHCVTAPY